MDVTKAYGQLVAGVGAAAIAWRRLQGTPSQQALGPRPEIPAAKPQGMLPSLKMPTARGWDPGQTPKAAPGLRVNAFASGLKHPRWLYVLPNGDVLAAEALQQDQSVKSPFDYAMVATMRRAKAIGTSPNRITLLRDADGDGAAEIRHAYLENLNQPFGMALVGDTFYVGATDGLVAFPFEAGATKLSGAGRKLAEFKPGGHWTRSLLATPDGATLFVGVGSQTNIADKGMEAEEGRACIYRYDIASGRCEMFAGGLRNPVGLAFEPAQRRLMDRRQRARRARRRDAAGLPHQRQPGRLLRLALLLLGPHRRRPRAAAAGHGGQSHHARFRARRPHRLARPVLASGRRADRLRRRHGDRPAWLLEPLASCRATASSTFRSRTAAPPARRATFSPVSSPPTRAIPTAAPSA